jgi:hypothetical protein
MGSEPAPWPQQQQQSWPAADTAGQAKRLCAGRGQNKTAGHGCCAGNAWRVSCSVRAGASPDACGSLSTSHAPSVCATNCPISASRTFHCFLTGCTSCWRHFLIWVCGLSPPSAEQHGEVTFWRTQAPDPLQCPAHPLSAII